MIRKKWKRKNWKLIRKKVERKKWFVKKLRRKKVSGSGGVIMKMKLWTFKK